MCLDGGLAFDVGDLDHGSLLAADIPLFGVDLADLLQFEFDERPALERGGDRLRLDLQSGFLPGGVLDNTALDSRVFCLDDVFVKHRPEERRFELIVVGRRDQHDVLAELECQIVRGRRDRLAGVLSPREAGDIRKGDRLLAVVAGKDETAIRQQDPPL